MKKLIISFILLISMYSCRAPYMVYGNLIDYSKYGNFFITESNSVSFKYTPISSVSIISRGGKQTDETLAEKYGSYKASDINDAFDMLYEVAIQKGANGVINVNYYYMTTVDELVVTGMLIEK